MKNQCFKLCSSESVECTCRRTEEPTEGQKQLTQALDVYEKDVKPLLEQKDTNWDERAAFNVWFVDLLYACKSCGQRDVLRNQKENLWEEWKKS